MLLPITVCKVCVKSDFALAHSLVEQYMFGMSPPCSTVKQDCRGHNCQKYANQKNYEAARHSQHPQFKHVATGWSNWPGECAAQSNTRLRQAAPHCPTHADLFKGWAATVVQRQQRLVTVVLVLAEPQLL
jgi:hypothetical protein